MSHILCLTVSRVQHKIHLRSNLLRSSHCFLFSCKDVSELADLQAPEWGKPLHYHSREITPIFRYGKGAGRQSDRKRREQLHMMCPGSGRTTLRRATCFTSWSSQTTQSHWWPPLMGIEESQLWYQKHISPLGSLRRAGNFELQLFSEQPCHSGVLALSSLIFLKKRSGSEDLLHFHMEETSESCSDTDDSF